VVDIYNDKASVSLEKKKILLFDTKSPCERAETRSSEVLRDKMYSDKRSWLARTLFEDLYIRSHM
jgi:hypothetical protein